MGGDYEDFRKKNPYPHDDWLNDAAFKNRNGGRRAPKQSPKQSSDGCLVFGAVLAGTVGALGIELVRWLA